MSDREILFRGQIRKKGEKVTMAGTPVPGRWIYGGIAQVKESDKRTIIYQREPKIDKFPVYADTVGQYTGLTDKNGKKIFEGDILKLFNGNGKYTNYEVIWFGNRWAIVMCGTNISGDLDMFFCEHSDIIGNIHDNPELLEMRE